MRRMNITAKIWLSVGVFALGFVLSTTIGQIQGLLDGAGTGRRRRPRYFRRPKSRRTRRRRLSAC